MGNDEVVQDHLLIDGAHADLRCRIDSIVRLTPRIASVEPDKLSIPREAGGGAQHPVRSSAKRSFTSGGSRLRLDKIVQAVGGMNGSPAADQRKGVSGRSVVQVTGMSGTGKSTVLAELRHHGHSVIDTDDPGWIVETHTASGPEPVWDVEQITALI